MPSIIIISLLYSVYSPVLVNKASMQAAKFVDLFYVANMVRVWMTGKTV